MINTLRASTFRKYAFGSAAVLAVLLAGTAAVVWAAKSGNDPEALKQALRQIPPLQVQVKLENDTLRLVDNTVKMDPNNNEVRLVNPPLFNQAQTKGGGNNNDPAINTTVTVFKDVKHGDGTIFTGWNFANGAATTPKEQFCYYSQTIGAGSSARQNIGVNGAMIEAPFGVKDQAERFAKCQWFNGHLG